MRSKIKAILGTDPMNKHVFKKPPHNFDPRDGLQPPSEIYAKKISDLINAINYDKKSKSKNLNIQSRKVVIEEIPHLTQTLPLLRPAVLLNHLIAHQI